MTFPLESDRLRLRCFEFSDARQVSQLAGAIEISETTLGIPFPYPENTAKQWIRSVREALTAGRLYSLAIERKYDNTLLGNMTIKPFPKHYRAELGYWIGLPFWGQGYATEAAARIVSFGFEDLGLNRISAAAMTKNQASVQVMKKLGMTYEGTFPQHVLKWGVYEDLDYYGMVRSDYFARKGS